MPSRDNNPAEGVEKAGEAAVPRRRKMTVQSHQGVRMTEIHTGMEAQLTEVGQGKRIENGDGERNDHTEVPSDHSDSADGLSESELQETALMSVEEQRLRIIFRMEEKLRPDWEVRESRSKPGRFYYLHTPTMKSSWNPPSSSSSGNSTSKSAASSLGNRLARTMSTGAASLGTRARNSSTGNSSNSSAGDKLAVPAQFSDLVDAALKRVRPRSSASAADSSEGTEERISQSDKKGFPRSIISMKGSATSETTVGLAQSKPVQESIPSLELDKRVESETRWPSKGRVGHPILTVFGPGLLVYVRPEDGVHVVHFPQDEESARRSGTTAISAAGASLSATKRSFAASSSTSTSSLSTLPATTSASSSGHTVRESSVEKERAKEDVAVPAQATDRSSISSLASQEEEDCSARDSFSCSASSSTTSSPKPGTSFRCATLHHNGILQELKALPGDRVRTAYGLGTVTRYRGSGSGVGSCSGGGGSIPSGGGSSAGSGGRELYEIDLDWRWDDDHVWHISATASSFERVGGGRQGGGESLLRTTQRVLARTASSFRASASSGYDSMRDYMSQLVDKRRALAKVGNVVDTPFGPGQVLGLSVDGEVVVVGVGGRGVAFLQLGSIRQLPQQIAGASSSNSSSSSFEGSSAHSRRSTHRDGAEEGTRGPGAGSAAGEDDRAGHQGFTGPPLGDVRRRQEPSQEIAVSLQEATDIDFSQFGIVLSTPAIEDNGGKSNMVRNNMNTKSSEDSVEIQTANHPASRESSSIDKDGVNGSPTRAVKVGTTGDSACVKMKRNRSEVDPRNIRGDADEGARIGLTRPAVSAVSLFPPQDLNSVSCSDSSTATREKLGSSISSSFSSSFSSSSSSSTTTITMSATTKTIKAKGTAFTATTINSSRPLPSPSPFTKAALLAKTNSYIGSLYSPRLSSGSQDSDASDRPFRSSSSENLAPSEPLLTSTSSTSSTFPSFSKRTIQPVSRPTLAVSSGSSSSLSSLSSSASASLKELSAAKGWRALGAWSSSSSSSLRIPVDTALGKGDLVHICVENNVHIVSLRGNLSTVSAYLQPEVVIVGRKFREKYGTAVQKAGEKRDKKERKFMGGLMGLGRRSVKEQYNTPIVQSQESGQNKGKHTVKKANYIEKDRKPTNERLEGTDKQLRLIEKDLEGGEREVKVTEKEAKGAEKDDKDTEKAIEGTEKKAKDTMKEVKCTEKSSSLLWEQKPEPVVLPRSKSVLFEKREMSESELLRAPGEAVSSVGRLPHAASTA